LKALLLDALENLLSLCYNNRAVQEAVGSAIQTIG